MQQLIPTGKQVNGMPTFTIASVPVTLPASPGGVAAVNTSQVPIHLSQSNAAAQVSQSPTNTLSPPAIASSQNMQDHAHQRPTLIQSTDEKSTKQWKTCPVCSELFPSNVYQVHMQVAHKQQVFVQNQDKDWVHREKLAARAPFLRLVKEKVVRCLSCKCFVSEVEVLKHLMHGIECLFCTWTFHDLKSFVEHNITVHSGYKKMRVAYNQPGQLANDLNGDILFPRFDFNTKMPPDIPGGKEIHLALLGSTNTKALVPIYIKVQAQIADVGVACVKQAVKCPFCQSAFAGLEVYETHLKERHHIMPTVHTILKTPAFKCIHCCGVYTGNMTLAAISVHLLRCRSAPKDGSFGLQAQSNGETFLPVNGEIHSLSSTTKSLDSSFVLTADQRVKEQALELALALSRKKKMEVALHPFQFPVGDDLRCLALDPKQYQNGSKSDPKKFLTDYFHRRPYPTKREVEILSSVFSSWKIDVAEFFCGKQQLCLKAIESQESCVVLGFNMSELKNMKHKLSIGQE